MAISSNINFIFEVSESCLMIENLILKKKLTYRMGLVSHRMVTFICSTFPDIVASVLTGQYVGLNTTKTNTLWH